MARLYNGTSSDKASVALKRDAIVQLVYRHAISTVMPMELLNIEFNAE